VKGPTIGADYAEKESCFVGQNGGKRFQSTSKEKETSFVKRSSSSKSVTREVGKHLNKKKPEEAHLGLGISGKENKEGIFGGQKKGTASRIDLPCGKNSIWGLEKRIEVAIPWEHI